MATHEVLSAAFLHEHYLSHLPSVDFLRAVDVESGAVGPNAGWERGRDRIPNVRAQEVGELLICAGLVERSSHDVNLGVDALAFGFRLQSGKGAFPAPDDGCASYAGTAFFLASAAGALLMLEAADDPVLPAVRRQWCPYLGRSVEWLERTGPAHPELTNHVCAAAGGAAMLGAVYPARSVLPSAKKLCDGALNLQSPDGSWPERGGGDTHYQGISLIYLTYASVTMEDDELRGNLSTALQSGFEWLAARVGADGSVDCSENTRKRWDLPPEDNEAITGSDFVAASYALRMWSAVTGEDRWSSCAERIEAWIARERPGGGTSTWDRMVAEGE